TLSRRRARDAGSARRHVKVGFSTLPVALPQAQAGSIIAAAEKTRLPELPDTPTIAETIPGVINVGWNGLLAPAGTPAPIINKLNALTVAALALDRKKLAAFSALGPIAALA